MNKAQIDKLVSRVRLITGGTGFTVKKGVQILYFNDGFYEWQRVKQGLHHYFKFIREDDVHLLFQDPNTESKIALKKFGRNGKNLVRIYPSTTYEQGGLIENLNKEYSFNDLF